MYDHEPWNYHDGGWHEEKVFPYTDSLRDPPLKEPLGEARWVPASVQRRLNEGKAEGEDEGEGEEEGELAPLKALGAPKASRSIGAALAAPLLSPVLSPQGNGAAGGQEDSASASYDEFALLAGNYTSGKAEVDAQIDDFLNEN